MTTRDIQAHLAEVYGADVSPALVSDVTGVIADEITTWQARPLDASNNSEILDCAGPPPSSAM